MSPHEEALKSAARRDDTDTGAPRVWIDAPGDRLPVIGKDFHHRPVDQHPSVRLSPGSSRKGPASRTLRPIPARDDRVVSTKSSPRSAS